MDVRVETEQRSPHEVELRVTVPAEEMTQRVQRLLRDVAQRVKFPGFRPGRVPPRVVAERLGRSVTSEAVEETLQEAYRRALEEAQLRPLSAGEMSDVHYEAGQPLTFRVKVEVMPEFTLPPLSEITVEMPQPRVEEEDVLAALDALREQQAVLTPTADPVDQVCVIRADLQELDASGFPIVGRVQKNVEVDLTRVGSDDPFAAAVIGLHAGQSGVVELPVRDGERERRTARFAITVHSVLRKELPVPDDAFARAVNPRLNTLDELKQDLRRYLEARAAYQARERAQRLIVEQLLRRVDFTVPPRMLEQFLDQLVEDATRDQRQKVSAEDVARFKEEQRATAIWNLRWHLVRLRLIRERMIEVTDEEYQAEIERLAQIDGRPLAEFRKRITEEQARRIREDLLEQKLLALLLAEVQLIPRPMTLAEFEGRAPGRVLRI